MSPQAFAAETQITPSPAACASCGFEPEALALEKLLKEYKELADNGGWPEWKIGKKLRPHQLDTRIPTLRQLLTITGDYKGTDSAHAGALLYDDGLAAGVRRFQTRHGLNPDGALGKATQAALAVPVETRITQITATIARIRIRAQTPEARLILVNLPAYTLYAIRDGHTALAMRVIIGNRKNPTPLFDNDVTDVIFNPQWHVPERIAKNELIPKLHQDPRYFINAGFVVTQGGQPVDPLHVDPAAGDDFGFRQMAGSGNALGKVKFNIPDEDNIYLHSTASPRLFAKEDRALSHGCVRVERPRELTHFVFDGAEGWGAKRIDSAYDSDKERWVKVQATPVHLVYWTAFVDAAGMAYFFDDVYGLDRTLSAKRREERPITLAAQ
jgi:murein L,D-transpeptidase YcbB/YkuD